MGRTLVVSMLSALLIAQFELLQPFPHVSNWMPWALAMTAGVPLGIVVALGFKRMRSESPGQRQYPTRRNVLIGGSAILASVVVGPLVDGAFRHARIPANTLLGWIAELPISETFSAFLVVVTSTSLVIYAIVDVLGPRMKRGEP